MAVSFVVCIVTSIQAFVQLYSYNTVLANYSLIIIPMTLIVCVIYGKLTFRLGVFGTVTTASSLGYFAERVLGRPEPKVGLLNIGAEPSKGTALQKETYALLTKAKEEGRINFVGNVEAREAVQGAVDVIVSDGYSGNIFLKTMEGTGLFLAKEIKKMFLKSLKTKIAALLVKDGIRDFKKLMDSGEVGGTALVGISKPVIKAHGSSDAYAIKNAIRQAVEFKKSGIIEDITENVEHMRLPVKAAPADSEKA